MNWKPERAHHCSECGNCVYKVKLMVINKQWGVF
jgi:hypothetical protein